MSRLKERTRAHLESNWRLFHEILGNHPELDVVIPPGGTVLFPRLKRGSVELLARRIRAELETAALKAQFDLQLAINAELSKTTEENKRRADAAAQAIAKQRRAPVPPQTKSP